MWWWLIPLYLVGWGVVYRIMYLEMRDQTQRQLDEDRRSYTRYGTEFGSYQLKKLEHQRHRVDIIVSWIVSVTWPLALVGWGLVKVMVGWYRLIMFLIFPRGIKTKYDREKELEQQKAESDKQYQEARQLLRDNGIEVE